MAFDRFLIAPINTGLQTDLKPWLIANDAYQKLDNAYVFRGRVRKRFGGRYSGTGWTDDLTEPLFSRLRVNIGTTDGAGDFPATAVPTAVGAIGQQFSIGDQIFTVYQANGAMFEVNGTGTGTFNTATGSVTFTGADANTDIFWYPALPVMGITQYETLLMNENQSFAFDTKFAYKYVGSWVRDGDAIWHGDDTDFFWTTNWQGLTDEQFVMFVTNFQASVPTPAPLTDDPIWYYDGTNWLNYVNQVTLAAGTFNYTIIRGDGSYLLTSRILLPFKDRLIALNTIEYNADTGNNEKYVNRCRFTINGSPFATTTVTVGADIANASYAWLEPRQTWSVTVGAATATVVGKGAGFIDAPTDEEIISAEYIKDRLIVYFEKSTWELVYTGNQVQPFVFQKINTELGADATFSTVPFDQSVLAIGNVGVHSCSGTNVLRIDEKIPDEIFEIKKDENGVERVAGIRDYYAELVYWTLPTATAVKYPNKVLCYNYRDSAWALFDDCITTWGYFEQQPGVTWASTSLTWAEFNDTWGSGPLQANFRQVIAGNQQGYIFIVDSKVTRNAAVMSITNMTQSGNSIQLVIVDHGLLSGEFISVEKLSGVTITHDGDDQTIFKVFDVIDDDTILIGDDDHQLVLTGTYAGGAVSARVSNLNILSKRWNPYIDQGRNFYLARIDFAVDKTTDGEVTVDYYPSGSNLSMLEQGNGGTFGTGTLMGTGVLETSPYALYPFEQQQELLWHPVYFQTDGQTVQIRIFMNDDQMIEPLIAWSDFVLEGLVLHTQATSARLQ